MFAAALTILWLVFAGEMLRRFLRAKNNQSADAIEERWRVSRLTLVASTLICGVMFLAVASASIYALVKTPDLPELPVYIQGQLQKTENKARYFGWLSFIQFWFFIAPVLTVVRWRRFRRRLETIVKFDIHLQILSLGIFWTGIGANFLYSAVSYYITCLYGDCSLHWQSAVSGDMLTSIFMFIGFIAFIIAFDRFISRDQASNARSVEETFRAIRLMFVICFVLCGIMLFALAAASIYATNTVKPLKIPGGLQAWAIFIQFWFFAGPTYVLMRPKYLRQKMEEYQGKSDPIRGGSFVLLIWTFFAAFACYTTLSYYGSCLQGECKPELLKPLLHGS